MTLLPEILSSKVRAEVFRLLFGLNNDAFHVRELVRQSGFALGTIQTEMKKLDKLNLVEKRRDGNRLYYSANQQHPIYPEIRSIVLKTIGIVEPFKKVLSHQKEIQIAFVFGSISKGLENAESDIDLMVIGRIGLRSLTRSIHGLSEQLGREINPYILTPDEFISRKSKQEHFLSRVLNEPKLYIKGNKDDLDTMV